MNATLSKILNPTFREPPCGCPDRQPTASFGADGSGSTPGFWGVYALVAAATAYGIWYFETRKA